MPLSPKVVTIKDVLKNAKVNDGTSFPASAARHLFHVFPSFTVGGSQIRFGQLAAAHGERYRHTVLALDGRLDMQGNLPAAARVSCIVPDFEKKAGLRNLPKFRATLRKLKPDLLVTYNWGSMEWALANRVLPIVPHLHIEDGFGPEERERQFARRIWTRRLALSGRHTRVLLPSRLLEGIAREAWRLPARSVLYVPNGVDCDRFAEAADAGKNSDGLVTIGTVATLRAEKNLARLILAFAALAAERPEVRLTLLIVGDGPERAHLESVARNTGMADKIVFTGASAAPEEWLAKMDVFALSSLTEQMPLSILEAMASALPIAALAVGDVANIVAEENRAFVVEAADEAAFRKALGALIDDADLRARLGAANRRDALGRFDHSLMAARYAELYG